MDNQYTQESHTTPHGQPPGSATAPYNFVPLPKPALEAEPPPSAATYHADRLNGHIDLCITTLTPLYIRGTAAENQLQEESKNLSAFYAPTGRPAIPGSSIRGMLRTLVEIASASSFDGATDSRFTYRAVAEQVRSSLTNLYRGRLTNVSAGLLTRIGGRLRILPSRRVLGCQYWRIRLDDAVKIAGKQDFVRCQVVFHPTPLMAKERQQNRAPLVTEAKRPEGADTPPGWASGWLVVSGPMQGKRHAWIISEPDDHAQPLDISTDDERAYRESWADALQEQHNTPGFHLLPEDGERVPCFYATYQDADRLSHVAFGHTRWFRVPYTHSLHTTIPPTSHRTANGWDLAQSVFGRVSRNDEAWAGRVFVEDAILQGDPTDVTLPADYAHVLSSPKPTTFQHYLEQPPLATPDAKRHWDTPGAEARGYKLYWHRPGAATSWQATVDERQHQSQLQRIEPVKVGSVFTGRLRFENLTEVELGALVFVLDLPTECRHRLGMGKPLGLGSISVEATVYVDDRPARYRTLFTVVHGRLTWTQPELSGAPNAPTLRAAFARWLLDHTPTAPASVPSGGPDPEAVWHAAWDQPRLRALRAILTWTGAPPDERTRYMGLDDFKGRPVLPDAVGVLLNQGESPVESGGAVPSMRQKPPVQPKSTVAHAPADVGRAYRPETPPGTSERAPGEPAQQEQTGDLQSLVARHGGGASTSSNAQRERLETKQSKKAKRDQERLMRNLRGGTPTDGGSVPGSS